MFRKARTVTALFFVTAVAALAVSLGAASSASAAVTVCAKGSVCVTSVNSCTSPGPFGSTLIFDEGEELVTYLGKWKCVKGQWVLQAAAPTTGVLAPSSGQATTPPPPTVRPPGSGQILPGH